MIKIKYKNLKIVALGIIAIYVFYFVLPHSTTEEVTCKETMWFEGATVSSDFRSHEQVHKINESTNTTRMITEISKDADSKNDFCLEFKSKGVLIRSPRERKPGMLSEVREVILADEIVFFLETSCADDLNPRQSCSVESAARVNPEKQVYVLFISPDANLGPDGGQNIRKLKSIYANIHFHYLDIINYTKGTKMEKWVENQTLTTSSYKVSHLSDGLRFLTLCKYGGIYMDLDVVVMHSLTNMSNFGTDQSEGTISAGVMSMKANGTLANACLDEYVNDFRGNIWGHNGPAVIDRALRKTCERKTRMLWNNCDGTFLIYPPKKFYPIPYQSWRVYFEESNEKKMSQLFGNSTAIHLWNKLSEKTKVKVGSNVIYGVVASKYCPLSYWNSGQFF